MLMYGTYWLTWIQTARMFFPSIKWLKRYLPWKLSPLLVSSGEPRAFASAWSVAWLDLMLPLLNGVFDSPCASSVGLSAAIRMMAKGKPSLWNHALCLGSLHPSSSRSALSSPPLIPITLSPPSPQPPHTNYIYPRPKTPFNTPAFSPLLFLILSPYLVLYASPKAEKLVESTLSAPLSQKTGDSSPFMFPSPSSH